MKVGARIIVHSGSEAAPAFAPSEGWGEPRAGAQLRNSEAAVPVRGGKLSPTFLTFDCSCGHSCSTPSLMGGAALPAVYTSDRSFASCPLI